MKFLKDIITIFIILFISVIAFGAMFVLLKAIFVSWSTFIVIIFLVFLVSLVYSATRYIQREFK